MPWAQQLELLKENLAGLGARRLAALGLAATVVIAAVALVASYASRPETEPLYIGLSPADVSRIGIVLSEAGIPFDIGADGTKIYVRRAQAPNARMLLAERGLPAGATLGYEIFDKLGPLGLTSFMQDVARTRALEGELARTIQSMKGVVSARVHIVLPPSNSFRRSEGATSASVLLKLAGPAVPAGAVGIVRQLVAAAVPGLLPASVSVMSTDGSLVSAAGDADTVVSEKMIEIEQIVARRAEENVRRTLIPYLGAGNFQVSASARVNLDKRQLQEQIWDPESKAERSTRTIKEQSNSEDANVRQETSVEQNIPAEQSGAGAGEQSRKSNGRKDQTVNFELNSKTQTTVSEGHKVESLQLSLVVNRRTLANSADAAAVEKQLKEIEAIAAAAAGINAARGDKLSVSAVEFADGGAPGDESSGLLERAWLHLDTVIMSITAIAALLIVVWAGLLPSVRTIITGRDGRAPIPQLSSEREPPQLTTQEKMDEAPPPAKEVVLPAAASPTRAQELQARLTELVDRDDMMVAEVLKQWMLKA